MTTELKMLTIEQRIEARRRARALILSKLGEAPQRAASGFNRYPSYMNRMVLGLMGVVFVAAALPSLFRLYRAGYDHFITHNPDTFQAALVGGATFLLAEFLVIVSTLTMRVYFTGRGQWVMLVPITLGISMALVGNIQASQPDTLFEWLETCIPPIAVLFMALIGERLLLNAVEQRQEAEKDYQTRMAEWNAAKIDPETSELWPQTYAEALREALVKVNARRKDALTQMTTGAWRGAVRREMAAESWFQSDVDVVETVEVEPQPQVPFGSTAPEPDAPVSMPMTLSANGHGTGVSARN